MKPKLLDRQLDTLVDPPAPTTLHRLLGQLALQAAIAVPGEAWKVHDFSSARIAVRWANWMILRGLVPEGRRLDVRGASLYVIHPERTERNAGPSGGAPSPGRHS